MLVCRRGEYVAPALVPPVYFTTTVTTGLVCPQFSSTAVGSYAPCVVGSLPPVEEFTEPVYDQVLQEHIAASELTENLAEIPVVHEQVIVQEIPDVTGPRPPFEEFSAPVYHQVHQELFAASETTENIMEIPVVQEQVIVGVRPERLVDASGPQRCERAACPRSPSAPLLGAPSMASPSAEAIDESTLSFLLAENLARVKEKEEVEKLLADLDRREQKLLEEIERHRTSRERGAPGSRVEVACLVVGVQDYLGEEGDTASPGRYTKTGRAAAQQHDPGGASVTGHRQTP